MGDPKTATVLTNNPSKGASWATTASLPMNTFFVFADADIAARHDPTWLYSTLAQTAGALVGLLGAVLISRVISHIAALETPIAQVRQRAIEVLNQVAENAQTAGGRQNVESFGL